MSAKKVAYINSQMLVWARAETPFKTTLDVAENVSGISADKLTSWENGEELPSINEAKKLAQAYRIPLAAFFMKTPPEHKIKRFADRRTFRGTKPVDISYALWKEINRITSNREKIIEYADRDDLEKHKIPHFAKNVSFKRVGEVVRDYLGLKYPFETKSAYGNNAFSYYRSILEQHGIIVAQISGISLEEMRGLSIFYEPYSIIAINNKDYERAKVFSLFHELAHIVRRSSSLCLIDFNERNDDEEKICDRIAAEILMPEEVFVKVSDGVYDSYADWNSESLQLAGDRFGVSALAVLVRLHDLRLLSDKEYHRIFRITQNDFVRNKVSAGSNDDVRIKYYVKFLSQQGYLLPRTILAAHARGDITYGEMCSALNVKREHLSKIERAVMFA
ncbi:MAG: ImmA/IrrE family metallo-endopeptidase [Lachnospiraceae bacterium]|nr:ImmA/IrrE family metallo-endopeptidase [Lachnospiraceae bacterium]